MSQANTIPQSGPKTGAEMAAAMQTVIDAINSGHKGASRPSYAVEGTRWLKEISSTLNEVYEYDGTDDVYLHSHNPTTHALIETALASNQVTLGKLQQISSSRILGRKTASTGNVESLTAADVMTMLPDVVGDSGSGGVAGRVPAPAAGDAAADKFLKATGAWAAPPSGVSPGSIADFGMDSAPTGWLACYGQAVSRSTYAALYAAIGDTWGAGNGSTTFNLPDLRGRVRAGKDNMGGISADRLTKVGGPSGPGVDGDTMAATGGEESHQLTVGEMPIHSHSARGVGSAQPQYSTFAGNGSSGGTGNAGGDQPHNNLQPTAIVLTCIKT